MVTKTAKTATAKKVSAAAAVVKGKPTIADHQETIESLGAQCIQATEEVYRLNGQIAVLTRDLTSLTKVNGGLLCNNAGLATQHDIAVRNIDHLRTRITGRDLEVESLNDRLSKLYLSNAVTLLVLIPLLIAYFH